ncbi:MAG TPA: hypothetical protein DCX53_03970 [Anaerolineae bacterium]|nr:hypothetical protein [Anaerolineae bacterium]
MWNSSLRIISIALLVLLCSFLDPGVPNSVSAQEEIIFRNATVENIYPDGIVFRVEICGRPQNSRVYFDYKYYWNWEYWWYTDEWTLDEGQTDDGCDKRKVLLETKDLYMPPFSPVKFYWSVFSQNKVIAKDIVYIHYYKDDGFDWSSQHNNGLTVWWHDRPDAFGADILQIAEKAVEDQSNYYSIELVTPVTIVVFISSDEFFGWQAEEGYAGGMAFPEISLTTQLVDESYDYMGWVSDVVPHELSHLFFHQVMSRQSNKTRWLDEGLATYNEYNNHLYEWSVIKDGYDKGRLISFAHLQSTFGDDPYRVDLAYAQSYYAILYLEEMYGHEKVLSLLEEHGRGSGLESSFIKAFGLTLDEFEDDYRAWLATRLNTPPPDTSLPGPPSPAIYFLFAVLLCLGVFFAFTIGGTIVIVVVANKTWKN